MSPSFSRRCGRKILHDHDSTITIFIYKYKLNINIINYKYHIEIFTFIYTDIYDVFIISFIETLK